MRVLMQTRQNALTLPGGDTTQLFKTKAALEAKGVSVDVSLDLRPDLTDYDVVHLFNLTRVQETFFQAQNARKADKPTVLSTIYWPFDDFEKSAATGLRGFLGRHLSLDELERLKAISKFVFRGERGEGSRYLITHSYKKMQQAILDDCDVFLPNAETEMKQLVSHLGYSTDRFVVVPNAVDVASINAANAARDNKFSMYEGWLVCIGRIEIRKNQLALLKAIQGTDYKLVLVGKVTPSNRQYGTDVLALAKSNPNVSYIEQLSNKDVYSLFKACKVSVLPSWFETPGLVSLEAAAMGCNIVVSPEGTTRDYFGDSAFYCDVNNPNSIRKAIDRAYAADFDESFGHKVTTEYTWERAADMTIEGYRMALGIHNV
jgi:glycosyltransferase involved in cell wall biosynthesis